MREIKFRAWIKDPKEMVYYDKLMLFNGSDEAIAFHNLETSYIDDYEVETPFELMQFTGLKDKNGKGIYEGDVCHFLREDNTIFDNDQERTFAVVWDDIQARFGVTHSQIPLAHFEADNLEVIGNIYENPELLNK